MILDEVITRLESRIADLDVGGALDLPAAQSRQHRDTAYVIPGPRRAGDNSLSNAVRQRRTVGVTVLLAITNRRTRRGAEARQEVDALEQALIDELVGWTPDSAEGPLYYRNGQLLTVQDQTVWWQVEFETEDYIANLSRTQT